MKTKSVLFFTGLLIIFGLIAIGVYFFTRDSLFQSFCKEKLEAQGFTKNLDSNLCEQVEEEFFSNENPVQGIEPSAVGAPVLPVDGRIKFISFYDPSYLSSYAYCYFVFRGWFNPESMSPREAALAASGFAILRSELDGYPEWLLTKNGISCANSLKADLNMEPVDLRREMGDQLSIIAFNPVGAIRSDEGIDSVWSEARLTLNHERIHAIHVSCPSVDKVAKERWELLPLEEKEQLKEGHLNYDWSNPTVAVRESFAYQLEEDPTEVLKFMEDCQL